jgi:hypothetical protein
MRFNQHVWFAGLAVLCLTNVCWSDAIFDGTIYRTGGRDVGAPYSTISDVHTTVDHVRFTANAPGIVEFDLLSWEGGVHYEGLSTPTDLNGDGEIAFFDTHIRLFRDDGFLDAADLLSSNDDSTSTIGDDGSIHSRDSWLSYNLPAGEYILAVGALDLEVQEAIAGFDFTSRGPATHPLDYPSAMIINDHGDYRVTFIGDVTVMPVPAPGAAMLAFLGLGAVGWLKRRIA